MALVYWKEIILPEFADQIKDGVYHVCQNCLMDKEEWGVVPKNEMGKYIKETCIVYCLRCSKKIRYLCAEGKVIEQ